MLLTFILINISIPSPLSHSFISGLNILFLHFLPTVAFLFFFGTDSTDSPDYVCTDTSEHMFIFYFSFSVFHFLVVGSVRWIRLHTHVGF